MKNYKYILTHSSGNLTVEYNPVSWNNFNVVFKRSERYHSVLRSQIIDSEFPRDGKAYIDNIYETYGIDTDIGCEIQYLDKSDFTYSTLFDGIIDLSEWMSKRDTTIVKIGDSSNLSKLIARDNLKVPINKGVDIDGNIISIYAYLSTMRVEGVQIEMRALYDDSTNSISVVNVAPPITSPITIWNGVTDSDWDINDIGSDATLPAEDLISAGGPIYTNNSGGSIRVRYRVKTRIDGGINIIASNAWNYSIKAFTGVGGGTTAININNSGTGNSNDSFDTSYDSGYIIVTLTAGQTIELYHELTVVIGGGDSLSTSYFYEPIFVDVYEIIDAKTASDIEMPLFHELGAKLLEIITGQSDPLNAVIFGRTDSEPRTYVADGIHSLNGVASGTMLREFLFSEFPLVTSFADFFESMDACFNIGMRYDAGDSEFVIGFKEDFYKDAKIITLGEVKDLEITVAQEEYFNNILTGYRDKLDYEEVNGNQSFCVPGESGNDGRRIKNTKNLQSPYHADDYGIELSRKNADDKTTAEDSRYDDQTFIITGQRDGGDYETLQGFDDFTDIDGVYSPETRLNLNITPKRNLLRNANVVTIPMFKSENDTLFFNKQFELALSTKKSGADAVVEKDDESFTDLAEPIYYPELYEFTAPLTNDDVLQLLDDPHGYVEFDYLGETYQGYIVQVSTEPFNRRGNWTLLKLNPNR